MYLLIVETFRWKVAFCKSDAGNEAVFLYEFKLNMLDFMFRFMSNLNPKKPGRGGGIHPSDAEIACIPSVSSKLLKFFFDESFHQKWMIVDAERGHLYLRHRILTKQNAPKS